MKKNRKLTMPPALRSWLQKGRALGAKDFKCPVGYERIRTGRTADTAKQLSCCRVVPPGSPCPRGTETHHWSRGEKACCIRQDAKGRMERMMRRGVFW
jgi:hypothetical protein